MTTTSRSLFGRDDTMLGVCQGLGEDLGIHPNILRVAFAVALMVQPLAVVATYLGLGLVLAAVRRIWPVGRPAEATPAPAPAEAGHEAGNDAEQVDWAEAA